MCNIKKQTITHGLLVVVTMKPCARKLKWGVGTTWHKKIVLASEDELIHDGDSQHKIINTLLCLWNASNQQVYDLNSDIMPSSMKKRDCCWSSHPCWWEPIRRNC